MPDDKNELQNEEQNDMMPEINADDLALAQKKADEYLEGWKRAKADYLNYKKETEKRQEELIQFANAALIAELLPIIDNFKLALRHLPADAAGTEWGVGMGHIKKQFDDFLKQLGIVEIKTVGEKFDHNVHEAVAHEVKKEFAADVIFDEVKPGYTLHGKVISPAKVKVAK